MSRSIVCGHGIFVLIVNQKVVRWWFGNVVVELMFKGEFLVLSGRLVQMRLVEGKNEL